VVAVYDPVVVVEGLHGYLLLAAYVRHHHNW